MLFLFLFICVIGVVTPMKPRRPGGRPKFRMGMTLKLPTIKTVPELLDEYKSKVADGPDANGNYVYPSINGDEGDDLMFPDAIANINLPPIEGS